MNTNRSLRSIRVTRTRSPSSRLSSYAAVKPAKDVRVGDEVEIAIDGIVWHIAVLGVCDVRGPASVAQTLYEETEAGRAARLAELERRRTYREPAAELHGRPTKRDRRIIDRFSGGS